MTPLFYCRLDNFGDALNPYLMERLFRVPVRWETKKRARLCGIGSILTVFARPRHKFSGYFTRPFLPPLYAWTSGFIEEPPEGYRFVRRMRFLALRGKQSLRAAERLQGERIHVPLGDGGLLCAKLLDHLPEKRFALGLVPHVADFDDPIFRRLQAAIPHSTIIDLRGPPLAALEKIASCDGILSSSLHGLIAADSLGLPNRWIEVSDRVDGKGYKFRDYYSVFGLEAIQPLRIISEAALTAKKVNRLMESYPIARAPVDAVCVSLEHAFRGFAQTAREDIRNE